MGAFGECSELWWITTTALTPIQFSSIFLLGIGVMYFLAEPADRTWILTIPRHYVWPVVRLDVYIAFALLSAFAVVSIH
jgi:hypothetical protein